MELKRAYAEIHIKAAAPSADGKRRFTGIATTPTADRSGDIVMPKGAEFKLPLPLLWQHDSSDPIGWIKSAKVTDKGIEVEGEVASTQTAGALRDRLELAWQMIDSGLVRGLSIGFKPKEYEPIDPKEPWGALKFIKWLWLELSAVTIPANGEASILAIKSADREALAALGRKTSPTTSRRFGANQGTTMKTLKEMRDALQIKQARMDELADKRKDDAESYSDDDRDEMKSLVQECSDLQDDILDAQRLHIKASGARSIDGGGSDDGTRSRARVHGGAGFTKNQDPEDRYKGQSFTRIAIAKALGKIHDVSPVVIAQKRWGATHPKFVEYIKAAVAGGGTGSGEWGAELAQSDTRFNGDFVEYLYGLTVFDRLPGMKAIPLNVHVKGQDGAAIGYWVGESKGIPMSKLDFSDVDLRGTKLGALTVISRELMEDSDPSAEQLVRDGLAEAIAQKLDTTFLGSAAAVSGVSPAGILNGVTPTNASGADAAAVRTDMQTLLYPFVTNKMASGITLIMNPATAMALGWLINALGQPEFPGLNQNGGTLNGLPVLVGDNVTPGQIIAIRAADVWRIGESGVQVSMSTEATIEQSDGPTGATDTPSDMSTPRTSMFQEDSVAFKVTRRVNFQKRRAAAVQYIDNAEYGGVVS